MHLDELVLHIHHLGKEVSILVDAPNLGKYDSVEGLSITYALDVLHHGLEVVDEILIDAFHLSLVSQHMVEKYHASSEHSLWILRG